MVSHRNGPIPPPIYPLKIATWRIYLCLVLPIMAKSEGRQFAEYTNS